jgi:transposase
VLLEQAHDEEAIVTHVAGLDIGKASLVCCARVPDQARPGHRLQEVQTYATMTRSLIGLADRLTTLGVTRVVMEATSDYWKPVFYLLEAHGFDVWLVNARDVKHLPGRPKTDLLTEPLGITAAQSLDRHRGLGRIGDLRAVAVADRSIDLESTMTGTGHSA